MSDTAKLDVIDTFKDGLSIGFKNIVPILVNALLWIVTVWIPYLNVGTTIGLWVGVIAKASKGEAIPMTEIFDRKYRKYMGEFFLTAGFVGLGTMVGMALFIIPGFVIALAWSLSILLVIDKGKNPAEALSISNNCTYGNKWRMVGVYLLACIIISIGSGIVMAIVMKIPVTIIGIVVGLAVAAVSICIQIGMQASVYKRLASNV